MRHVAYQFLARSDRGRARGQQMRDQVVHAGVELCRRRHAMYQADAQGFSGGKTLGREEIAPRLALAHGSDNVGADVGRGQSDLDFGQAEFGLLCRDRDVAGRDQTHAAGKRCAVHARDRGLVHHVDGVERRSEVHRVGAVLLRTVAGHLFHPVQIGAGAERRTRAGEHHGAHRGIRVHGQEGARQLIDHGFVEGVAYLRTVHPDRGYALVRFHLQRCVFHASVLVAVVTCGTRRSASLRWAH